MTDGQHGAAAPNLADTGRRARAAAAAAARRRVIAVVPGFIGRAPDGSVTTLGRGGSDLTATLLARALGARRVVLWKDVPGILTADPAARARCAADSAAAPSRGGARSRTTARRCCTRARSSRSPARASCCTCARSSTPTRPAPKSRRAGRSKAYPVKALAIVRGQAIVTVAGKGMVGRPRDRRAHVRRGRRRAAVGLDDLPGVVRELDRVHAAGDRGRARRQEHPRRRSATS